MKICTFLEYLYSFKRRNVNWEGKNVYLFIIFERILQMHPELDTSMTKLTHDTYVRVMSQGLLQNPEDVFLKQRT
jgi:hypothetical protein